MDPMDIDQHALEVDGSSTMFSFVKLKYNCCGSTCMTMIRALHCLTSQVLDRIQRFFNDADGQYDNHGNELYAGQMDSRDDTECVTDHVNCELSQVLTHYVNDSNQKMM